MRGLIAVLALAATLILPAWARAEECRGRADALGVERVIAVDPKEHPLVGTMQYPESLPLAEKEVVLTFDDGPLPHHTGPVLEALAAECVKATFFVVGRQARAYPAWVRRLHEEGHTVATHSQNHPRIFTRLPIGAAEQEINQGIASVVAALGDPALVAPFFRFPGLGRSHTIEAFLASQGIMVFSADFPADDWTHISGEEVLRRALERLEHRGKGILLLHDIQPATAQMLPQLLRTLKERGFHVVHVVPASPDQPKTVTDPEAWVVHKAKPTWPSTAEHASAGAPVPSLQSFGWPHPFRAAIVAPMPLPPSLIGAPRDFAVAAAPLATFSLFGGFGAAPAGGEQLVVSEETLAAMVAPAAIPLRKSRPVLKVHHVALPPPPLAGLLRWPPRSMPPARAWP